MLISLLSGFLFGIVLFFVMKKLIINLLKPLKEQTEQLLVNQSVLEGQHKVMLESINNLLNRYGEQVRLLGLIIDKIEIYQLAFANLNVIRLEQSKKLEFLADVTDSLLSDKGIATKPDLKELETFITKLFEESYCSFLKSRIAGETITIGCIYNAKVVSNSSKSIVLRIPHSSDIQSSTEV